MYKSSIAGAAIVALLSTAARANLLINGSLESIIPPKEPDDLVYVTPISNNTALPGWTVTTGSIDVVPKSYWQNTNGNYSVDLVGTPGIGSIRQRVTGITPGHTFLLTFDFAANPESLPGIIEFLTSKILLVQALGADGTTLLEQQPYIQLKGTRTKTDMQFQHLDFTFVADGTAATIVMSAVQPNNLPQGRTAQTIYTGPVIDNLDLEDTGSALPSVPEPASLVTLGAGALFLLKRRPR